MKMNRSTPTLFPLVLALATAMFVATPTARALDDLVISEFMAENNNIVPDENGDYEDWIEIYNAGTNTVNLNGWVLTDNPNNLTKWRFPATNIAENSYILVFASNKDRRIPGRPLHTNFRLDDTGEYLALVKPDGLTIVSALAPRYPLQSTDISYGISTAPSTVSLVSSTSAGKFTVPVNGNLELDWFRPEYNDGTWGNAVGSLGFENNATADIADAAVVADSLADWSDTGVQGANNWYYGVWVKTNASLTYTANRFSAFPSGTGPHSLANFWDGAVWRWFDGEPPFDLIAQNYTRPSIYPTATTNGLEHQVIRRWVSEISGPVSVEWRLAKKDPTGGGVTGRVFHNNTSRDTLTLTGNNTNGQTKTIAFTVQAGDTVDFVLEPMTDVIGDATFFNATIRGATTLAGQFQTEIGALMTNLNSSAYLRLPFTVTNLATIVALRLKLRYDDGFTAYLNGSPIVSRNAPEPTVWNSAAATTRADGDAAQTEVIDLTSITDLLRNGNNLLAIQGLNSSTIDGDFLIAPQLEATVVTLDPNTWNYFLLPTPGSANGVGTATLGPIVTRIQHEPHDPLDTDDLVVTARLTPTFGAVTNVQLYYRVMFGSEVAAPMLDDGLHGDVLPGDGIYGARVPNGAFTVGEMVRYYIVASDSRGGTIREPRFSDATQSGQYFGAVAQNPTLTNNLPVMHLFITPANLTTANANRTARVPCSIYYLGEFYDNLGINQHGQSSSGFPKKSYDIDFNADHHFLVATNIARVDDINLLTTFPDKARVRNALSYGTYRDAGSPYHYVIPVRVQTNGNFYGDWHIVENGDSDFLKRVGRDPKGALYKMYNTFTTIGNTTIGGDPNAEKKTRKHEGNADLVKLFVNISTNNLAVRTNYMWDNVNVSEVVNATAARNLTGDVDCCHKNYYFYQDSEGTGEWEAMPWDVDLSFGRNWQGTDNPSTPTAGDGCSCYWDTNMYPANYVQVGNNNSFWQAMFNTPATRSMYYRRLRTLMDEQLQPIGTPTNLLHYEAIVNQLVARIAPDGDLDLAKWGTWGNGTAGPIPVTDPMYQTTRQAANVIITNFLPARRLALYNRTAGNSTEIPDAQPTNVFIRVGSIDYKPDSGNQNDEFIELVNTNTIAVDISGWTLSGAVNHTLQGGVVIPPSGRLYVVPNKRAFRARTTGPRGGQGLYIEGEYKGQLSARGETIVLSDKTGRIVNTNAYLGNPSPAQQFLRVTEIMYHPSKPPAGSLYDEEEFEYIELKNIGATPLDLTGVRFATAVEFTFTGSAITSLAPGAYVLVVRNIAAFTSRYGAGLPIAGQYVGFLDNGGENIQIDDAVGEKVLDFSFNNAWYPVTDGPGASLVIVNENAVWSSWDLPESWRPSFHDLGSPSQVDPAPAPAVPPVIITEALTHTDLPSVDQIEIFNPTNQTVAIGGWYLSDDRGFPRKYRIPDGRTIGAGAYMTFTEADFNDPGSPTAFSLSSKGDEVYLFAGDGTGITGYFQGYSFDAAENGVTFGRYVNSQTNIHFVAQSINTLGGANSQPKVGPVVITEINYRPAESPGAGDNNVDEYIEIYNITGAPVPLFDPAIPANTWRIRGGVDLDLPSGVTLPANGFVLLVNFDPAYGPATSNFRSRFSVPASVPLFGPFSGNLGNSNDTIRLLRPDAPDAEGTPYIVVDTVEYLNRLPWPSAADGIGASLQRRLVTAYGNDPTNWTGVGPSAGNAFVPGGSPPTVTQNPVDTTGVIGRSAIFSVAVSGTSPFFYQWRHNGKNVEGNGPILTLTGLSASDAGSYSCVILNGAGSAESSSATLSIFYPPSFATQPSDLKVMIRPDTQAAPTTNATFTAVAVSPSQTPLRYQWYFNGVPIAGATSSSYTVVNVQTTNYGQFYCTAADSIDTVESLPATLYPMIRPIAGTQPISQTVPVGGLFTLGFSYYGHPGPFTNEWRRGSLPILTTVTYDTNDVVTLRALPGVPTTNTYRAVVKNVANPTPGLASSTATIITVADTDGDGIPDSVETALGLNPSNGADGAGDLDGDTMTNQEEYAAGTDPQNPASYLKVEQATIPGTAIVRVAAVAGKSYLVQYSDSLATGQWFRLAGIVAKATDHVEQVPDPEWTDGRFYRIVLLLE